MVKVGSARHDENGNLRGGKAGDQTGHEVETQKWYKHKKGWVVIRAKSSTAREKIAQDMEWACANPNIGYDQSQNGTLFAAAKKVDFNCSKVTVKCETDCSRLVRVCCWYAGIEAPLFYTGTEVDVLRRTGAFEILTSPKYTESPDYLVRGDILVTKTTGHTVVVLNDGDKAPKKGHATVKSGSTGEAVRELQRDLNLFGYRDSKGERLKVDGSFGAKTLSALKAMQKDQGLKVDGICGPITWARLDEMEAHIIRVRVTKNLWIRKEPAGDLLKVLQKGTETQATRTTEKDGFLWSYLPVYKAWTKTKYLEVV